MARDFIASIDIGTKHIRVGVANGLIEGEKILPKMIGFGISESSGLRQGCIVDKEDTAKSVAEAIRKAEKNASVKIKNVLLSVGSIGLAGIVYSAEMVVSKADLEVTDLEVEKLISLCEASIPPQYLINRKILIPIPISYRLDGKTVIGSPLGMKGNKIEMKCLFVTVTEKHLNDLVEILGEDLDIEVSEAVGSPIAGSLVLLSKHQKKAGCILVNIGAETVSVVVYENSVPVSIEVFPVGSNHITNDIALGLKISLEEAEHIKLGGITSSTYPRKKLEEIIEARLSDIFDMIESHLKKIGRNGLLPAGVIFTGGGSGILNIENFAKEYLKLPAKVGILTHDQKIGAKDTSWSNVYGLCLLGLSSREEEHYIGNLTRKTGRKIQKFIKQFMP